jgi:hypothetical protein
MRALAGSIAVVLCSVWGSAQAPRDEVLAARAQIRAAAEKGDKATFRNMIALQATWIDATGRLRTRETLLAELSAGPVPNSSTPTDIRMHPDAAIVVDAFKNAQGAELRAVEVWARVKVWQLVAYHETPVGSAPSGTSPLPSSKPPAPVGAQADIKAVTAAADMVEQATLKGDVATFGSLVVDDFVLVTGAGAVRGKAERLKAVAAIAGRGGAPPPPTKERDVITRVYGASPVTTLVIVQARPEGPSLEAFNTLISIKRDGKWLRAGVVNSRPRLAEN